MSEEKRDDSELSALLARIDQLEKRVAYLENKPPQYVPPPVYGPIKRNPITPGPGLPDDDLKIKLAELDKLGGNSSR